MRVLKKMILLPFIAGSTLYAAQGPLEGIPAVSEARQPSQRVPSVDDGAILEESLLSGDEETESEEDAASEVIEVQRDMDRTCARTAIGAVTGTFVGGFVGVALVGVATPLGLPSAVGETIISLGVTIGFGVGGIKGFCIG